MKFQEVTINRVDANSISKLLPKNSGVYFILYYNEDRFKTPTYLYVGESENLYNRFSRHPQVDTAFCLVDEIVIRWVEVEPARRKELEALYIGALNPVYNVQKPKPKLSGLDSTEGLGEFLDSLTVLFSNYRYVQIVLLTALHNYAPKLEKDSFEAKCFRGLTHILDEMDELTHLTLNQKALSYRWDNTSIPVDNFFPVYLEDK
jgi:hypothetical protein